jgi:hypothetical protein
MRPIAAIVALLSFAGGCTLLVGGTDGYHIAEAGSAPTCTSAADCSNGEICCFSTSATIATLAPAGACQSSCSVPQLCAQSTECGAAVACVTQPCSAMGITLMVKACGTAPSVDGVVCGTQDHD